MSAIELDRVTIARAGRVVLSDVSLAIRPGEFIGVFGANGAGKTTLLHAVLGLLPPTHGVIKIDGAPPARGNANAGYLPQHRASITDLSLRGWDFVASAYRGERWGLPSIGGMARREVDTAIATVDAHALAGRPLCELSGGELQRLLLAQAMLGQPKLLLLDEPLLSLDPHFQESTVALVKRVQQERHMTVLFTAHELNPLLDVIDRVLYLGQGGAALGTVEEVITSKVLSRLYGSDIEVLHVDGRVLVVSGHGLVEVDAHRHDARV